MTEQRWPMSEFKEHSPDWTPSKPQKTHPHDKRAHGHLSGHSSEQRRADERSHTRTVKSLLCKFEGKLQEDLDPEIQIEMVKLVGLLVIMRPRIVARNIAYFELAFDVLAAEKPNLLLARGLWTELEGMANRSTNGMTRIIDYLAGNTTLSATISALIAAMVVSIAFLFLMLGGHQAIFGGGFRATAILEGLTGENAALMVLAIHAAFVGGIVSILARIQDFVSRETATPPLIFISVFRKPFLGAAFGVLVFSVLKIGLISFPGVSLTGDAAIYTAWVIGFLCGFSERFAQDIVESASSRFGGTAFHLPEFDDKPAKADRSNPDR